MAGDKKAPTVNGADAIVQSWRRALDRSGAPPDPLLERVRERRNRIRARVGLLDDSVALIREDRDR